MKAGTKLKSAVCSVEVMVIKPGSGTIECGGAPMTDAAVPSSGTLAGPADGTLMGKRYVDAAGTVELLCIKAGKGTLSVDGIPLVIKDAKPLPASD